MIFLTCVLICSVISSCHPKTDSIGSQWLYVVLAARTQRFQVQNPIGVGMTLRIILHWHVAVKSVIKEVLPLVQYGSSKPLAVKIATPHPQKKVRK
jgi:hypothetical protein